jgi:small-conductance mechanosensitive channel
MKSITKAALGAGLTYWPCAILATPSGDPFSMLLVGAVGALLVFLLLYLLFTRRAAASWTIRRQVVLSGLIGLGVTFTLYVIALVSVS